MNFLITYWKKKNIQTIANPCPNAKQICENIDSITVRIETYKWAMKGNYIVSRTTSISMCVNTWHKVTNLTSAILILALLEYLMSLEWWSPRRYTLYLCI